MKTIEGAILEIWNKCIHNEIKIRGLENEVIRMQNNNEVERDNSSGKKRNQLIELFLFGKRQQAIELREKGEGEEGLNIMRMLVSLDDYAATDIAFRKFIASKN